MKTYNFCTGDDKEDQETKVGFSMQAIYMYKTVLIDALLALECGAGFDQHVQFMSYHL